MTNGLPPGRQWTGPELIRFSQVNIADKLFKRHILNKQKSKLTNKGSFIIEARLWNIVQTKLGIVINHLHNLRMILSKVNKMLYFLSNRVE